MNILVINAEPSWAGILQYLLADADSVDMPADSTQWPDPSAVDYDLVVLAAGLNLEGLNRWRDQSWARRMPVLLLIGQGQEAAAVTASVDDFMVVPQPPERLNPEELRARMQALLKRVGAGRADTASLDGFRVRLSDTLRSLSDPIAIQAVAARVLGEYLQVSRALYFETEAGSDSDYYIVQQDYCAPGVSSVVGSHRADDFGPSVGETLRAGQPLVVTDAASQSDLTDRERAAYLDIGLSACIVLPLIKHERHVASLAVQQSTPRAWTPVEVALVEETAERTWAAVERARAEAALRDREQRLRWAMAGAKAGSWDWELGTDQLTWSLETYELHGMEPSEAVPSFEEWCHRRLHPDDQDRVRHYVAQLLGQRILEFQLEFRILHPQKGIRWLLSLGRLMVDFQGEPMRLSGINLDISDRKQAELALRQNQETIRQQLAEIETIYQSAPIGLNVLDRDLRFVRINQRLAEINGLPLEAHIGRTVREVLPDLADTAESLLRPILETGQPLLNIEIQGETPAQPGVKRTWLESFLPLKDGDRVIGINTVCEEITERVQIEQQLRASEERFRALSATAPVGILQTDAAGQCLYSNHYWQSLSGLSLEQSLGSGWQQALHPEDRQAVARVWSTYLQGGETCQAEFRLQPPQGEIWVSARSAAIYSAKGDTIGHVCIYVNITDQKQALQDLHRSQQQLQTILDNSPAVIYVMDLQHRHLLVNRSYADLLHTVPAAIVGKTLHDLWPADIADAFVANNQQVLETRQRLQIEEVAPYGTVLHTYLTVKFPLCNDGGVPYALCGISTDITEQKDLQAQFYQAQRLESLGRLASGIAHDLNNIFTPILTLAQLLRLSHPHLGPAAEQLQLLEDSAKRGADLVKQMLTLTRRGEGVRQRVQLLSVVEEVVGILRQSLPKSIDISTQFSAASAADGSALEVLADPSQLHQVFMNLCVNARDAMPEGGQLTLSAQTEYLDEATAQQHLDAAVGPYAVITVTDTGTGMTPEVCDRIFDPFFTTKPKGQGTGLGLSTVFNLVKGAGGFLQVLTAVDQGTTFKVFLPLLTSAASALPTPPAKASPALTPGQGEWILVVDDDLPVQRSLQTALEHQNYRVLVAHDGPQAIECYQQWQQSIQGVILDVNMPKMSGIDLIGRLREMDAEMGIIAISGLPANRQPTLAAGANVFLAKPYAMRTLLRQLSRLLQRV